VSEITWGGGGTSSQARERITLREPRFQRAGLGDGETLSEGVDIQGEGGTHFKLGEKKPKKIGEEKKAGGAETKKRLALETNTYLRGRKDSQDAQASLDYAIKVVKDRKRR